MIEIFSPGRLVAILLFPPCLAFVLWQPILYSKVADRYRSTILIKYGFWIILTAVYAAFLLGILVELKIHSRV